MKETQYRKHPAISHSELLIIAESPEKYKYYKENPPEQTENLLFGQYFHAITLQPECINDFFVVFPKIDKRTKEGKAIFEQLKIESQNKTIIPIDMAKKAEQMKKKIIENKLVERLLKGKHETPYFWEDELTNEQCKCRVDSITEIGDNLVISDIKTTQNAETEAFTKSAIKYGYDMQAAMYCAGVEHVTKRKPLFVFVAIEKNPPYAINILQADQLLLQRGYDKFRELLGIYHDCKVRNDWYGYLGRYNQINTLALPYYLAKEVQ